MLNLLKEIQQEKENIFSGKRRFKEFLIIKKIYIEGMDKRNQENESNSSSSVGFHSFKHGTSYPY